MHPPIDIHGAIKGAGTNEYDKVCNIYDLEGNVNEHSAERLRRSNDTYEWAIIVRGGQCNLTGYPGFASGRSYVDDQPGWSYGYRMALYVMK